MRDAPGPAEGIQDGVEGQVADVLPYPAQELALAALIACRGKSKWGVLHNAQCSGLRS